MMIIIIIIIVVTHPCIANYWFLSGIMRQEGALSDSLQVKVDSAFLRRMEPGAYKVLVACDSSSCLIKQYQW